RIFHCSNSRLSISTRIVLPFFKIRYTITIVAKMTIPFFMIVFSPLLIVRLRVLRSDPRSILARFDEPRLPAEAVRSVLPVVLPHRGANPRRYPGFGVTVAPPLPPDRLWFLPDEPALEDA